LRVQDQIGDDPAIFLRNYDISAELVGTVAPKGFQVEPRRWKIEQTFGCLQRYRRLRVDDEISHDTSRQMTLLASVFMIGMRLRPGIMASSARFSTHSRTRSRTRTGPSWPAT
jgi:hypothetical protein